MLGHFRDSVAASYVITTVAGSGVGGTTTTDGIPATSAPILNPYGVCVDTQKNFYSTDSNGRVRKIDSNGIITTVAGNGSLGYSGDGGPATLAKLYSPNRI